MFRNRVRSGFSRNALAALVLAGAALAAWTFAGSSPAHAFGDRYERFQERSAYGWRPSPPAIHGFWGQRRWQRYNDGFGFRPPSPRPHYGYDHGWR